MLQSKSGIVDEQGRRRLVHQQDLLSPGDPEKAAVAVGDRVHHARVRGCRKSGTGDRCAKGGDQRVEAAVAQPTAAGIGRERVQPGRDVEGDALDPPRRRANERARSLGGALDVLDRVGLIGSSSECDQNAIGVRVGRRRRGDRHCGDHRRGRQGEPADHEGSIRLRIGKGKSWGLLDRNRRRRTRVSDT